VSKKCKVCGRIGAGSIFVTVRLTRLHNAARA